MTLLLATAILALASTRFVPFVRRASSPSIPPPSQQSASVASEERRSPYRHSANPNYPSTDVKLPACTKEQIDALNNTLGRPDINIRGLTHCPENSWIEEYYRGRHRRGIDEDGDTFLVINVGCNKGYEAVGLARFGTNNPKFDLRQWSNFMRPLGPGACNQLDAPQGELDPVGGAVRPGEIHCIEPVPPTVEWLRNASKSLGLDELGLIVSQAAVSSRDGTALFAGLNWPGGEPLGIGCGKGKSCAEVPMFSLPSYVESHVKVDGPINILSIDVEGHDFDVLFGAGPVLDRTEYLEFEYHNSGNWGKYSSIADPVRLLDGKGFNCYWAGKKKLWRITDCYLGWYDWHGWSNVACVHRSQIELAGIMEDLFNRTLGV